MIPDSNEGESEKKRNLVNLLVHILYCFCVLSMDSWVPSRLPFEMFFCFVFAEIEKKNACLT